MLVDSWIEKLKMQSVLTIRSIHCEIKKHIVREWNKGSRRKNKFVWQQTRTLGPLLCNTIPSKLEHWDLFYAMQFKMVKQKEFVYLHHHW
jgi:hypothetical protein